jgi:hypothetical protein
MAAGVSSDRAHAQTPLQVDVSASYARARPPAAVQPDAGYGLFGLGARLGDPLSSGASLTVGTGVTSESAAPRWIEGAAAADLRARCALLHCGVRIEGNGLRYPGDQPYTAGVVRIVPELRLPLASAELRATGQLARGTWESSMTSTGPLGLPGPVRSQSGTLAVTGGAAALGMALGPAWLQLVAEHFDSANPTRRGAHTGFGADAAIVLGRMSATAGARSWKMPGGARETSYSISGALAASAGLSVRAQVGRTSTDLLYGSPGTFMASLGIVWSMRSGAPARAPLPVASVRKGDNGRSMVRFTLRSRGGRPVSVAGDFNAWSPTPMTRAGDTWTLELALPSGAYHFAFLVGETEWMVPPDAEGIVDDGFGRKNATIVVE